MKTPAFWRKTSVVSLVLLPLSWLYGLGAWLDRRCTTPQRATIPVISIGNVTVGGTGKTPTALALAPMLQELGAHVHFISRGYGGKATSPRQVRVADDWREVGDEPLLLARTAPTWIARKRSDAIAAAASAGATLALCDDAHQHHALQKNTALLVIDGPYGIGNGCLLPAGPLREPFAQALRRSDAVIMIGEDVHGLAETIAAMPLSHGSTMPIFHATLEPTIDLAPLREGRWLAFAGTGRPEKFFDGLTQAGITLAGTRTFADHHPYNAQDVAQLREQARTLGARLITTEKDFVKLSAIGAMDIAVLPIRLALREPDAVRDFLRRKLS